jgi:hypothetical protein
MAKEIFVFESLGYVLVFAALAFALLTGVLYTLAVQLNHAIAVHDLIRRTRLMRAEYRASQHKPVNIVMAEDDDDDEEIYVAQPAEARKAA